MNARLSNTNIVTENGGQINPQFLETEEMPRFDKGEEEKMKRYTHVLWDFNGTLFDDVDACIKSANVLLENHGMPHLESLAVYREQFGFPVVEYYKRLGFDFEKTSYADLAVEWIAYYLKYSAQSTLYPDVIAGLSALQAIGIPQLVLSATERGMLERQITELGIRPYFENLLGMDDIHAYSKEEIALRWRKNNPDATLLMIGDTDHDAAVARSIGADYVLLSCGHQSAARLAACNPLCVAESITDALARVFGVKL